LTFLFQSANLSADFVFSLDHGGSRHVLPNRGQAPVLAGCRGL
jgi:hypothetical protein